MRNGQLPFRDIFSSQGPVFLPLRVGRRPRRAPHARRAAPAHGRGRRAAHGRGLLVRAPRDHARQRAARGRAGDHERLDPLGHRAGQRRRPVARAVGARGRLRAALPRRTHACANAVWVGLAAGGAVSIKALSVPALVIAGLIVLLSIAAPARACATRRWRRRSRWRVRRDRAALRHRRRVRPVVHVPPGLAARRTPRRGRVPQGPRRRCGTATSSCWWRWRWR